jgi:hypothetical protein
MSRQKKLGMLILSKDDGRDFETATGLAKAAIDQGVGVEIFLMGDGILYINDPRLKDLASYGASIIFCAQNAREQSISLRNDFKELIKEGSQYDLACIVENSFSLFLAIHDMVLTGLLIAKRIRLCPEAKSAISG